jgi:hypothetical protein
MEEVSTMAFTRTIVSAQPLQQQVSGIVLTPDHPDYEQARRAWDLTLNHYPALILIPDNAEDVAAGVRFARDAGLGIAVQSTGHGMQYPADDNLLIITSRMASVQVDAEARTARAEAGAVWKDILDQSTPHGLAPLLGSTPHVGVVGYTLGRGIGWLSRKYGFAADSVRWIDLVTADGVLRRASPTENSDLFWGLRGGGGNFGVVTALEFDLYPVPTVYGGEMIYPAELAKDALHFFRDWVKTVPDELTSSIAIIKFPSFPQLPDAIRGKTLVIVRAAYAGDSVKGAAWMQKWLDWHSPNINTFQEIPFAEIGTIQKDPVEPTAGFGSNEMLDELSDELIDVIVGRATDASSPIILNELRHAGGAIARLAPDSSAISHRDAQFYFQLGGPTPTPEALAAAKAYMPLYKEALRPYLRGGVYLNFVKGSEARERIKEAYLPETYERLLALKAKYDPENLFRYSYQLVSSE